MTRRSQVMSFRWPRSLREFFFRYVPSEARSAFTVRVVTLMIAIQNDELLRKTPITAEIIEACDRGWLVGLLWGAGEDPRQRLDIDFNVDFLEFNFIAHRSIENGIPPARVGDIKLVRRPPKFAPWKSIPGSGGVSFRWPRQMVESFRKEVAEPRTDFVANAVKIWLASLASLASSNAEGELVVTAEATWQAWSLALAEGIRHGASLLSTSTLDPAHVEDLVDREITAYLLERWTAVGR